MLTIQTNPKRTFEEWWEFITKGREEYFSSTDKLLAETAWKYPNKNYER